MRFIPRGNIKVKGFLKSLGLNPATLNNFSIYSHPDGECSLYIDDTNLDSAFLSREAAYRITSGGKTNLRGDENFLRFITDLGVDPKHVKSFNVNFLTGNEPATVTVELYLDDATAFADDYGFELEFAGGEDIRVDN